MTAHLDQLQLSLAKAIKLVAAKNQSPEKPCWGIAELERRILEHLDNREAVAARMKTQRGAIIDPKELHAISDHGQLKRHVLPKPNGGQRIIHAPDDRDCANGLLHLAVLTPIAETTAHHYDHGFRPRDHTTTPVTQVTAAIKAGYKHIVQLDVANCFHNLPITEQFMCFVPPRTQQLLNALHRVWRKGEVGTPLQGLPQGHPLAPAYCNLVLNRVFAEVRNRSGNTAILVRYADDITILSQHSGDIQHTVQLVTRHLAEHGMAINATKTTVTEWKRGTRIDYLGYEIEWSTSGPTLAPKPSAYARLRDKLEKTSDTEYQGQILIGWFNAFSLTDKPGERERAIDFVTSLQALRLHSRSLPAPTWGAIIHELQPVACQSRFLDHLEMMEAARKVPFLSPSRPAKLAITLPLLDGGPHHFGPSTFFPHGPIRFRPP